MFFLKLKKLFKLLKNRYFLGFLFGIMSLYLIDELSRARIKAPPPLVKVKEWSLMDSNGNIFESKNSKGKVVVVNFFFTGCSTLCRDLTLNMKKVYDRLKKFDEKILFLSISIDPENDSPDKLNEYKKKYKIFTNKWFFLTGDFDQVHSLVVDKMKLYMEKREPESGVGNAHKINHLAEIILLDHNGDIRGKFDTTPTGLASLVSATNVLINKK